MGVNRSLQILQLFLKSGLPQISHLRVAAEVLWKNYCGTVSGMNLTPKIWCMGCSLTANPMVISNKKLEQFLDSSFYIFWIPNHPKICKIIDFMFLLLCNDKMRFWHKTLAYRTIFGVEFNGAVNFSFPHLLGFQFWILDSRFFWIPEIQNWNPEIAQKTFWMWFLNSTQKIALECEMSSKSSLGSFRVTESACRLISAKSVEFTWKSPIALWFWITWYEVKRSRWELKIWRVERFFT